MNNITRITSEYAFENGMKNKNFVLLNIKRLKINMCMNLQIEIRPALV